GGVGGGGGGRGGVAGGGTGGVREGGGGAGGGAAGGGQGECPPRARPGGMPRLFQASGQRFAAVRSFHQPWPYPIEGDDQGDVEYALDKADWERQYQTGRQ